MLLIESQHITNSLCYGLFSLDILDFIRGDSLNCVRPKVPPLLVKTESNKLALVIRCAFCFCLCCNSAVISRSHEGPGEMGKAVNIPKDDQEKMKELFKINQFNLMASDMIALNRSLPDVRLDG